ncbi:ATP-binding protein [Acidithiobacillus sp. HP-6]|uniref:ATP-binding protein n=1 Tax=unclassified Acidithiobacillus TaxID=2614800 RepID=UPI00187A5FEF|nr:MULTISPECIES: ATP-binding protein [unclassified Acidithiobacillus]MBE7562012.1 ATP-binding protein [Acidithiobacillus sp. HP-6]MBE7568684.1 ATP-binding protein [Acidithiobacillus sp. HP-2]
MTEIKQEIAIHAARLCQAIARIGYEPQTALLDIVDNAVTASASDIRISLYLAPGKTLKNRNSVATYQVIDNGYGMTNDEIVGAFALGANGNYRPHSLSKYGMGLKSAGLSLGSRIHIVSKKNGVISQRHTFDIDLVEQENRFIISSSDLLPDISEKYTSLLPGESGTVVEIDGCEKINHQSPSTTVRKLEEEMGVIYAKFLTDPTNPVRIGIRVCAGDDAPFKEITPLDILFLNEPNGHKTWDPETYDFVSPYLLLDEKWKPDLADGKTTSPIRLTVVAFPQDALGKVNSPLTPADRERVKQYEVSRKNAGFFIYRNERLIRWGDSLGMLSKDEFNIRIRMDLTEEHDDVLHVDVTKQRFEIDDELLGRLKRILDDPRTVAKLIMKKCHELLRMPSGREGEKFTDLSANVAEDDPEEMARGTPPDAVLERQQAQAIEADEAKAATTAADEGATAKLGEPAFAKIRYTDHVDYQRFWTPYRDAKEGVFVCVNTTHPFYTEFLKELADNAPERVLLETLIFAAGVAEINTVGNLYDVGIETIKAVFDRFHRNYGTYLANFTSENINLLQE